MSWESIHNDLVKDSIYCKNSSWKCEQ